MTELSTWIWLAGFAHWSVLIASALVPIKLRWHTELSVLKPLHRQMYWTYGGYVVMSIIAFGVICVSCSEELAAGSRLARVVCGYIAIFWAVRLCLQAIFDVKPHLTHWTFKLGYHTLTVVFISFTVLFAYAAIH